jgi:hypothetical protein
VLDHLGVAYANRPNGDRTVAQHRHGLGHRGSPSHNEAI